MRNHYSLVVGRGRKLPFVSMLNYRPELRIHSGYLSTTPEVPLQTLTHTYTHCSDFNGQVQTNFTPLKRAVSSFLICLLSDRAVCVCVCSCSFYELCFISTEPCSKGASPCVMTKERSQHKGSCHGNLYGQKCHTLTGFGSAASWLCDRSTL